MNLIIDFLLQLLCCAVLCWPVDCRCSDYRGAAALADSTEVEYNHDISLVWRR